MAAPAATTGRPSLYSDELADEICTLITQGLSVQSITDLEGMPSMSSIFSWFGKHATFLEKYTRAREMRAHARFERTDQVLQDLRNGLIDANTARIEIDTIKWQCGKENAGKYGDRMLLQGDKDNPLVLAVADVLRQREKQLTGSDATTIDIAPEPKQLPE